MTTIKYNGVEIQATVAGRKVTIPKASLQTIPNVGDLITLKRNPVPAKKVETSEDSYVLSL
jgi:hypothetical protein